MDLSAPLAVMLQVAGSSGQMTSLCAVLNPEESDPFIGYYLGMSDYLSCSVKTLNPYKDQMNQVENRSALWILLLCFGQATSCSS